MSSDAARHAPPALLAPLAGDKGHGEDPKHSAPHEQARAEVAKLTALTGGAVDWEAVERSAASVLQAEGKDLLMGAYWTAAAYRQRSFAGLLEGLSLLGGLCEGFGEGLYPLRPRARTNAIEWLVDDLAPRVADHTPEASDRQAVETLQTLLPLVSSAVAQLLGDGAPSLRPLQDALHRASLALAEMPAPQGADEGATPPAGGGAAAAVGGAASEASAAPPAGPTTDSNPTTEVAGAADEPGTGATDDLKTAARARAERWLEPISETTPAGSDARYDERHEAARAEVAKLDTPSGGLPDWQAVHDHADALLREVSKDLVIATHLCQALWVHQRCEEIAASLWLIEGLHARYGADLFPQRARARANSLQLLAEKLEACIGALDAESLSADQVGALVEASEAMFERIREHAGDTAPSARGVGAALKRLELTVLEREAESRAPTAEPKGPEAASNQMPSTTAAQPAQAQAPTPNASAPAAGQPAHVPEAAAAPVDAKGATAFLRNTARSLAKLAAMLGEASPTDPAAYRLRRTAAWLTLTQVSEAQLTASRPPPPNAQMRHRMQVLHAQGNWQTLAREAEAALAVAPSWLDLQRFSVDALEGLGADYRAAAAAVTVDARALVAHHPALLEVRFSDDTHLVSPETRDWLLAGAVTPRTPATAGASESGAGPGLPADLATRLKKSAPEALAEAQRAIESERSERGRFLMRLELARGCRAAGLSAVTEALLADLEQAIDEYGLGRWDPELAGEALAECLTFLESRGEPMAGDATKLYTLRARLAHLAPASLAHLASKS